MRRDITFTLIGDHPLCGSTAHPVGETPHQPLVVTINGLRMVKLIICASNKIVFATSSQIRPFDDEDQDQIDFFSQIKNMLT